jgi:hypothetical protein
MASLDANLCPASALSIDIYSGVVWYASGWLRWCHVSFPQPEVVLLSIYRDVTNAY